MSVVRDSNGQDRTGFKPNIMIYGVGYYGAEAVRILVKKGWPIELMSSVTARNLRGLADRFHMC
ncbi:hypothetical protein CUJ87_03440 [Paraburkholderia caledonica]|jgi:hypothetical protein|nr:hypothetical protein CUJ87_03440 [Paraburkholderia caledonica]